MPSPNLCRQRLRRDYFQCAYEAMTGFTWPHDQTRTMPQASSLPLTKTRFPIMLDHAAQKPIIPKDGCECNMRTTKTYISVVTHTEIVTGWRNLTANNLGPTQALKASATSSTDKVSRRSKRSTVSVVPGTPGQFTGSHRHETASTLGFAPVKSADSCERPAFATRAVVGVVPGIPKQPFLFENYNAASSAVAVSRNERTVNVTASPGASMSTVRTRKRNRLMTAPSGPGQRAVDTMASHYSVKKPTPVVSSVGAGSPLLKTETAQSTSTISTDHEFDFPDFPVAVFIAIMVLMTLAFVWAIMVYLINVHEDQHGHVQDKHSKSWRGCILPHWFQRQLWRILPNQNPKTSGNRKRKPIDKPSKYAPVPNSSPNPASSTASWMQQSRGDAFELRLRQPSQQRSCSPAQTLDSGSASHPVTSPSALSARPTAHSISVPSASGLGTPEPPSPTNPLLPPMLTSRTSQEWAAEREAFDSGPVSTLLPRAGTPTPTSTSSAVSFDSSDALEAQTPLPLASPHAYSHARPRSEGNRYVPISGCRKADGGEIGGYGSYVNEVHGHKGGGLLNRIDDGVTKAMHRFVGWVDDEGRGEESVLPVAARREA